MQINPLNSTAAHSVLRSDEGPGLSIPPLAGNDASDSPVQSSQGKSFGQWLQSAIGDVNQAQNNAYDLTTRFAAGEPLDVHQVMIASQEASVSLQLATEVRNKIVEAYQELSRISL
jgi:flagellar hook-basal body complex protein FliE